MLGLRSGWVRAELLRRGNGAASTLDCRGRHPLLEGGGLFLCNSVILTQYVVVSAGFRYKLSSMARELRPMVFRKFGKRALGLTIPAAYVQEMGLVPGDTAIVKREPDGLRLRIIRHSKLLEFANASEEG